MALIKTSTALILVVFGALQLANVIATPPPSKMKKIVIFSKVDYDVNSDYLKMDVILKNNTDAIPSVDLRADLLVDMVDSIYITSVLSRRSAQKDEYWPLLKSSKLNLCEIAMNPERELVHKFLMDTLKRNGLNMLSKCPVKQGNYSLKDFTIEGTDLPSFTLPGDYKVEFTITHKSDGESLVKIWRMTWFATIANM